MKLISKLLVASVATVACVAMVSPAAGATEHQVTASSSRPFIEVHSATLNPVAHDPVADGGSSVRGHVTFIRIGRQLIVLEYVSGAAPGLAHAQHVHGIGMGTCPGPERRDDRGLISTPSAAPDYGMIQASLTTRGDTSPASGLAVTRFPVANPSLGAYLYARVLRIGTDIPAEVGYNIQDYVAVVHGIDINHNGAYDFGAGPSLLDPTLPFEATVPAACGAIN